MSFHITPGVIPSKGILTSIIQASGGTVEDKMRPLKALKEARQQNHYIITCETDLHLIDDIFMTGLREWNTASFGGGSGTKEWGDWKETTGWAI